MMPGGNDRLHTPPQETKKTNTLGIQPIPHTSSTMYNLDTVSVVKQATNEPVTQPQDAR
jgi:hypothetical protein